jgi:hypothetical protein
MISVVFVEFSCRVWENGLGEGKRKGRKRHRMWITKTPGGLAGTLMYGQCTTTSHGSYAGIWITKTPDGLTVTLMYGQHTTNTHGSYAGTWITKIPGRLAVTLMYGQRTTTGHGSYGCG